MANNPAVRLPVALSTALTGDLNLAGHNIDFPTTANISDCLDEDTMASNSATKLATQQSIKAYVDANIGGGSVDTSGTPVANDFARFTDADTIAGRSYSEVKTDLSLNNVENTALSSWVGTASITTLGTVTTATLSAGAIIAGVTMTLGSDATSDMYYRSAGGILTRLPIGTNGHVLKVNTGAPAWEAEGGGTAHALDSATHTDVAAMTEATGDILYRNAGGNWDNVGIGTAGYYLKVVGGIPAWAAAAGGGDLLADGSVPLTADWDVAAYTITALRFASDQATGTAPFTVASTTVVANLNASQLEGHAASYFQTADAELTALAGLTFADDQIIVGTGAGTIGMISCTGFAQSILDDADAATARATLGVSDSSTTVAGIVELTIASEVDTGTSVTLAVTPDSLAGSNYGEKGFCIAPVASGTAVTVANGTYAFTIPATFNGWDLVDATASVTDKGVTGATDIQVRRRRAGSDADMLSTKITLGDEFFASDGVVNASNDDVNTGDQIYVDVDAIHSGTAPNGLSVNLVFRLP